MNSWNLGRKISELFLPKEVDFYGNLALQSLATEDVIRVFHGVYIEKNKNSDDLARAFEKSYAMRKQNLLALHQVLITPIDKEAISRAYLSLDWVVLSIKHLNAEIIKLDATLLTNYETMLASLKEQIITITASFNAIKHKNYDDVIEHVATIFSLDDELIDEYSNQLEVLFKNESVKFILRQREILSQIKEVSKRIHACANTIEDFVFKLN